MVREANIAVVGVTGAVGREFLKVLEERRFPINHIRLLASHRSAGSRLSVNGADVEVEETKPEAFRDMDFVFISVNTQLSKELAPKAVEQGALVIDDSSAFRMLPHVPLVVPEINGQDVEDHEGIIAIPNCCATPMVMALYPLHCVNPIVRIIVDTYQSVSGAGGGAVTELSKQSGDLLQGKPATLHALPQQIAFNLFPHIGDFLPSDYTDEEQKMLEETRKIMHAPNIAISATCVRVPVYISHSEAIHVEFEDPMSPEEARGILAKAPGVQVLDDPEKSSYPVPWNVAGTNDVFVGRIRKDQSHPKGLVMWVVADNLRKGAALNSLQIAEEVLKRDCLQPKGQRVVSFINP